MKWKLAVSRAQGVSQSPSSTANNSLRRFSLPLRILRIRKHAISWRFLPWPIISPPRNWFLSRAPVEAAEFAAVFPGEISCTARQGYRTCVTWAARNERRCQYWRVGRYPPRIIQASIGPQLQPIMPDAFYNRVAGFGPTCQIPCSSCVRIR